VYVCVLSHQNLRTSFATKGYTFEAQADGQPFTVTVPMGGVEEGLKFQVPVPSGKSILLKAIEGYSRFAAILQKVLYHRISCTSCF
jgi:hypothetical protein